MVGIVYLVATVYQDRNKIVRIGTTATFMTRTVVLIHVCIIVALYHFVVYNNKLNMHPTVKYETGRTQSNIGLARV